MTIVLCLLLGNSLDKFNSLVGTLTAAPVVFILPCLAHYKLCDPSPLNKALDLAAIAFALVILLVCTSFTLATWSD